MFGKDKEAARIGLAAHTAVLHKLVSRGLEVLQPLGDHLRYDLAYYLEETAELNKVYLVPIDIAAYKGEVHLRINPSRNNQMKRVIWASDYEI